MKKSEILKEVKEILKNYYVFQGLLVIYVSCLDWEHITKFGKYIVDITASENNDNTIRICFDSTIEID